MSKIKAYAVSAVDDEETLIIYAANGNRARQIGYGLLCDCESYIDARARRLYLLDGRHTEEHVCRIDTDDTIYRDAAFYQIDGPNEICNTCGLWEFDTIPESRVVDGNCLECHDVSPDQVRHCDECHEDWIPGLVECGCHE